MTRLPTRVHGILDYAYGAIALVLPSIGGFTHGAAGWIMSVAGAGTLLLAMLTDYELGLVRVVPMRAHIAADMLLGGALAILPPILRFSPGVSTVYVLFGLVALAVGYVTAPSPADGAPDGLQVSHSPVSGPASSALPAEPASYAQPAEPASLGVPAEPAGAAPPSEEGAAERSRIDSGVTGERVPARDPAAAPLGTDTEASSAGTGGIGSDAGAPGHTQAGPP